MIRLRSGVMLAAWVFLLAGLAHAEIYQWTDKKGTLHFSDTAPADAKKSGVKKIKGTPDNGEPAEVVGIFWYQDLAGLEKAKAEAAAKHAPLLIYFTNAVCGACEPVDALLRDPALEPCLVRTVKVRIETEHGIDERKYYRTLAKDVKGGFEPRLFFLDQVSSIPRDVPAVSPSLTATCEKRFGYLPPTPAFTEPAAENSESNEN